MPSASRNERKKRRTRRNLTLATRAYRAEAINRVKVQTVLLTVLAAQGGEIFITQEGLNSTVNNLGQAQYVVEKAEYDRDGNPAPEGLFVVRLVTGETATVQAFNAPVVAEGEIEAAPGIEGTPDRITEDAVEDVKTV